MAGLVGIAPAPDFTEDLLWARYDEEIRETLMREGVYREPSTYSEEPYVITRRLIEEGREHLLLREPIPLASPVRLLHGQRDEAVPYETSLTLADRLVSDDVEVTLIKAGDHRLSEPDDLARLFQAIDRLTDQLSAESSA